MKNNQIKCKKENKSKSGQKEVDVIGIILKTIAISGFVTMAVIAPNALQALRPFLKNKKYNTSAYVESTFINIKKRGLIKLEQIKGVYLPRLTQKGEERLLRYKLKETEQLPKIKLWDGKWRIVIFDIKEARRATRDLLRFGLSNFGFVQLQKSVWIYPHDCEELIVLLKADACIGKGMLYLVVEKLENDMWLKKSFGLV